jgi:hypothetical protein
MSDEWDNRDRYPNGLAIFLWGYFAGMVSMAVFVLVLGKGWVVL